MADIYIVDNDGTESNIFGLQGSDVCDAAINAARNVWENRGDEVKLVLITDGDPTLLSSWTRVSRDGKRWQPDMDDMRRWGLDEDVVDDLGDDTEDDGWENLVGDPEGEDEDDEDDEDDITPATTHIDTDKIIDEEGMGYDSVGPVDSIVVNDDGMLGNEAHSERADLSSEAAFREQVRRWKAAISA